METGDDLRALREGVRIPLKTMAELLRASGVAGIDKTVLCRIERGQRRVPAHLPAAYRRICAEEHARQAALIARVTS